MAWRTALRLGWQLAAIAVLAVAVLALRPATVHGPSMEPGIATGEVLLVNVRAYRPGAPAEGDVVVFHHAGAVPATYVKRAIGLPGDRVAIVRGTVVRNGEPLDEPYVAARDRRSMAELTVPPGCYFVLGDDRARSDDSRAFGVVHASSLAGRAVAGLWPLERIGPLP